ncbi:MAG: tandem-95 repeat protein, partial [Thermodesulfobacteriota bacterium]|nr:tandem-95 repeat protein [Thermodesulfobacteriota bacterium]
LGSTIVNDDGTITFTPVENYHGNATITVITTDDDGATATQTSTVTVSDINDAPTLEVQSTATMDEDGGNVAITFTAADVDGTIASTTADVDPDKGSITINDDGTITFTPVENYHGNATITVITTDDDGATATQTSIITVSDVNDAPTLEVISTAAVDENQSQTISFQAADIDGTVTTTATAEHGSVTVDDETGNLTYTPDTDYNGTDTITITTTDNDNATAVKTVDITVNDVNHAPTASDQTLTTDEDTDIVLTLDSFGYSDTDNEPMAAVRITSLESNGQLKLDGSDVSIDQEISRADIDAGKLTFTPDADEAGSDYATFSFQVSDGEDWSTESYTTAIDVDAIADAPVIAVTIGQGVSTPGQQTAITEDNVNFYVFDDASSYQNDDGQLDLLSQHNNSSELVYNDGNGWGVKTEGEKNKDGAKTLDGNESIAIQFDSEISSIDVSFKHLKGESTSWTAFDQDGNMVESGEITGPGHDAEFTEAITPSGDFQYLIINGNEGDNANGFYITGATTEGPAHTEYPVTIDISFTDEDGSESHGDTVTIEGIPADAVLSNGTHNADGTWTVSSDQLQDLTLNVPPEITDNFNLTISATSSESNGDISTTIQTASVTVNPDTSPAGNTITASSENDTISGGAGDDYLDGNTGTDTVVLSGNEADYTIVKNDDNSYTVQDDRTENQDGTDTIINVEKFSFTDGIQNVEDLTLSANLIDGAVEGVEYTTSSGLHGFTDENGGFSFKDGDDVTFTVGGVTLGTATSEDVATGKTFLQDIADVERTDLNDEYLENMATFLQSIDENSDAYDGIVITDATREALADSNIDLRTASEDDVQQLVEQVGKSYVSEDAAMDHVEDMLVEHTDLNHDEFEEHIDDDIDGLAESLQAKQEKTNQPGLVSSTAGTTGDTDSTAEQVRVDEIDDLSINIPSLDLPGEGLENEQTTEETAPTQQETVLQADAAVPQETSDESIQQSTDALAGDDLAHSLPSESLSALFDETSDAEEIQSTDFEHDSNSDSQSGTQAEEQVTDEMSPSQPETPIEKEAVSPEEEIAPAEVVVEQEANDQSTLSTDDLHIDLEGDKTEDSSDSLEVEEESSLDRFATDSSTEEQGESPLAEFSTNDNLESNEEISAMEELDATGESNTDQVDDAGLSDGDAIQEDILQEPEPAVDANAAG